MNEKEYRKIILPIGWSLVFCFVAGWWLNPSINIIGLIFLTFITSIGLVWKGIELIKGYNKAHWFDVVELNMELYNIESVTDKDISLFMQYKLPPFRDRHKIKKIEPHGIYSGEKRVRSNTYKCIILDWWDDNSNSSNKRFLRVCFQGEKRIHVVPENDFTYYPYTKERLGIE